MALSTNEQFVHHITTPPDPVRVEIKETAKGDPQVSVRMTGTDAKKVMAEALDLYKETRAYLEEEHV